MLRGVLSILLVLGVAGIAFAHEPPPAYLNMTIDDDRTEVLVVVWFDVLRDWFGVDPTAIPEDGAVDGDVRASLEQGVADWLRIQVDGRPFDVELVDAIPERFEDHLQLWEYVNLRVRVATPLPPRQVAVAWTQYASAGGWVFTSIDAEVLAYGETEYPVFKEREPEFTWHRPREASKPAAPVDLPPPAEPPPVPLPLVSMALVLAFAVVIVVRKLRGPRLAVASAVVVGAALLLSSVGVVEVPAWWDDAVTRPPDDEALTIFASLHRGVYTAVDGETEDEIYDDLDECVTGDLLERLYLDIHESLILKEEGGAVAKIQKTEITDATVVPADAPGAWFKVEASWTVEGKVGHWGHTHQRINQYDALVTVTATDGRWKIAEIDVKDERRIDDGKQVR